MAQPSNTHDRYDLATKGDTTARDISKAVYMISPTETPFLTMCAKEKSSNILKEWHIDSLASPDTNNKQIDGDEFANDALTSEYVLGNYHQISRKVLGVTRRAQIINKTTGKKEMATQLAKKGKELKRDIEAILLGAGGHQAAAAGSNASAPTTASIGSWFRTNVDRGATGASPTLSGSDYGTPNAAPTDGTTRALSEATLLDVIRKCYVAGGEPTKIMVDPVMKQRISAYLYTTSARVATPFQDHGKNPRGGGTVLGAVDVYVSDFGALEIVPNRYQRGRDVFVLDPEYWAVSYLTEFEVVNIAKTGDSDRKALLADYALVSKNEAASGIVADINSGTAMVA